MVKNVILGNKTAYKFPITFISVNKKLGGEMFVFCTDFL